MTFRDFCTGFRDYWPNFAEKNWNFSQCRNGYSAGYTPKYPEKTAADFDVFYNTCDGSWTLYAETACVPIIRRFESFDKLAKQALNPQNARKSTQDARKKRRFSGTNPESR